MSEARYQLIDRTADMPELVDSDTIEAMAESGQLEDWHRVLDTMTLATLTVAEIFGRAPTQPPSSQPPPSQAAAPAAPQPPPLPPQQPLPPQSPGSATGSGGHAARASGHQSGGHVPPMAGESGGHMPPPPMANASGGFESDAPCVTAAHTKVRLQAHVTLPLQASATGVVPRERTEVRLSRVSTQALRLPSPVSQVTLTQPRALLATVPLRSGPVGTVMSLRLNSVRAAWGEVYLGRREHDGAHVAIKVLPLTEAVDGQALVRFQREAKALTRIDSQNVVSIHFVGELNDRPCVVMDHVEGQTLEELLDEGHMFTVDEVVDIAKQVGRGLWAAAKQGIVHRDIKPSNLMMAPNGTIVVLDFGLAKFTRDDTSLTQTGEVFGTVRYMSPEQVRGEACSHRSDLYSLGATLYHLLSGKAPFEAETFQALMHKHLEELPVSLQERDARIPVHIDDAILRCLAKNPEDRFGSSLDLSRELDQPDAAGQSSAMVPALQAPRAGGARRKTTATLSEGVGRSRSPLIPVLGLLAAAGIGGGVYVAVTNTAGEPEPNPQPEPITTPAVPSQPDETDITVEPEPEPEPEPTVDPVTEYMATYVAAMAASDWEMAWKTGREVIRLAPQRAAAERVRIPLQITIPDSAGLLVDLEDRGRDTQVLHYSPGQDHRLVVWARGHQPMVTTLAEAGNRSWEWSPGLLPAPMVQAIIPLPEVPIMPSAVVGDLLVAPLPAGAVAGLGDGDQRSVRLPTNEDLGPAIAHPAVWGDQLILAQQHGLSAFSSTGQGLWAQRSEAPLPALSGLIAIEHELVPDATKLIAATTDGVLLAWTVDARGALKLAPTSVGGTPTADIAALPTDIGASLVVVATGETVQVYDGATAGPQSPMDKIGEVVLGRPVERTPTIIYHDGAFKILVASEDGQVVLIDPTDASMRTTNWQIGRPPAGDITVVQDRNLAIVGGRDGSINAIDLSGRGRVAWSAELSGFGTPVGKSLIHGDTILTASSNGSVVALDLASGDIRWQVDLELPCSAGLVPFGEHVALVSTNGLVVVLNPDS